ncbi:GerMN domain-containing protein, partial [Gorillibacterium massiliense]|uniref:GerMN domain-containing protein n=1 Tax=Gorillibacterium massiliense TaxID=1280390 RepID=UPI000694841C
MTKGKRFGLLLSAGMLAAALTGCSSKTETGAAPIDPPPVSAEELMKGITGAAADETMGGASGEMAPMSHGSVKLDGAGTTLYEEDGDGFVVPVSLALPKSDTPEQTALTYLVEDGPGQKLLPAGFVPPLPKGTKVNKVTIGDDGQALVDFSPAFTDYNPADERKILEALTWTLTGFPKVKSVKISVGGQLLPEMPQAAMPLDDPLTRAMGINLEVGQGVNPGRATPVTLYFCNQTTTHFLYHVPVTRLIDRTDDPARAA